MDTVQSDKEQKMISDIICRSIVVARANDPSIASNLKSKHVLEYEERKSIRPLQTSTESPSSGGKKKAGNADQTLLSQGFSKGCPYEEKVISGPT